MYRKTSTWYNVPLTSCLERDKTQPLNKPTLQSSAKSTPFGTSQTTSNGHLLAYHKPQAMANFIVCCVPKGAFWVYLAEYLSECPGVLCVGYPLEIQIQ